MILKRKIRQCTIIKLNIPFILCFIHKNASICRIFDKKEEIIFFKVLTLSNFGDILIMVI